MFWSSEKIKAELAKNNLIENGEPQAIKHAAYELALGEEAFLTSFPNGTREYFRDGKQICIPPGQFGLLITAETVKVPNNAIGFISIRARVKFRGLVNISGFHVDPGFEGKLKFSVYNAGSQAIVLKPGERIFMIWFADLDQTTKDGYGGPREGTNEITSQNVTDMQGDIASPAALKKSFDDLKRDYDKKHTELKGDYEKQFASLKSDYERQFSSLGQNVTNWKVLIWLVLSLLAGVLIKPFFDAKTASSQNTVSSAPTTLQPVPRALPSLHKSSPQ